MKQILKCIMFGFLCFLGSCLVSIFGYMTVTGFCAVCAAVGWEAAGLVLASLVTGFLTLFVLFMMGAIPLGTIEELKFKLKDQEEEAARDYEALYKAATYDYQHKGVEK